MFKESNSRANEGKRQFNRSIIYNLDSIVRVNDNPKFEKKMCVKKNAQPMLELSLFERPIEV